MDWWVLVQVFLGGAAAQLAVAQWLRLDLELTVAHRWLALWAAAVAATLLTNGVVLASAGTVREVAMVARVGFVASTIVLMVVVVARVIGRTVPRLILWPLVLAGVARLVLWVTTDLVFVHAFTADDQPIYAVGHLWTSLPTFPLVVTFLVMTRRDWADRFERDVLLVSVGATMVVGAVAVVATPIHREVATGMLAFPLLVGISTIARHRCRHLTDLRVRTAFERDALGAELAVANGELRSALAVRDDLLDATTHELRTPLTPIGGFTEILRHRWRDMPPEAIDENLDVVHRNVVRMGDLVEEMLSARHLRPGAPIGAPDDVEILPVLQEVRGRHPDVGMELRCVAELRAYVNRSHFSHILQRLVENAVRHGAPPIEVTVRLVAEGVEVRVVDHGPGVSRDFRERLFEPFTQASVGSVRTASGVGLGLSVARRLAEAMGGTLEHAPDSSGDSGACFVLIVPSAPVAER